MASVYYEVGLWNPQLQMQITPFCWGFAFVINRTKIAIKIGPLALALWYRWRGWRVVRKRLKINAD